MLIILIRGNITFTTTDIPSTINTHNTELQMVKVHINNTKHITIANFYIPPRDSTSTQMTRAYDTAYSTYITNTTHSVLTGDVNAHSTLWHPYTDDHERATNSRCHQQLGPHNTKHTHQPDCQTPHYNKHLHQISPWYLTHYTTGHHGQLNTHYHLTTYPSSPQSPYDMTTDCNKTDEHLQTTKNPT